MIAILNKSAEPETVTWQEEFLQMMPTVKKHAQFAFRNLDAEKKEDAVSEVVANTMCAFRRLYERGEPQRIFASALARFAIKQFHDGRRVGTPQCTRDVFSPRVQSMAGFGVCSLNGPNPHDKDWVECLVDERRTPVPDQVAFRVDFPTWLTSHSKRDQRIVNKSAQRYSTSEVAGEFQISLGRVSQLRRELAESWREFNTTRKSFEDRNPSVRTENEADSDQLAALPN